MKIVSTSETDTSDEALAAQAAGGDAEALDALLRRQQKPLYHLALRMLQTREDAEDATQDVLVKIATHLSSFRGESAFRTWAYRIMANHLLDRVRSRPELSVHDFDCYADYLARAPDADLPPKFGSSQERELLVKEAKSACLLGMTLCLEREERLVFLLGEVLEAGEAMGAAIMDLTPENFRQRLSRARRRIYGFMAGHCGLVDPGNACRCPRKTAAFIRDGIVDPRGLVFTEPALRQAKADADAALPSFERDVDALCARLYRQAVLPAPPDIAAGLRQLVSFDKR